jgi:hypothetical protein
VKYKLVVPKLFPDSRNYPDPRQFRSYIQECMEDMIKDGSFCLTFCMLQSRLESQTVLDIIAGVGTEPDHQRGRPAGQWHEGWKVPQLISRHMIVLEPIDSEGDFNPKGQVIYTDGMNEFEVAVKSKGGFDKGGLRLDTNYVREDPGVATVPIRDAAIALLQHGYGVRPAIKEEVQRRWWTCRESNPLLPWTESIPEDADSDDIDVVEEART